MGLPIAQIRAALNASANMEDCTRAPYFAQLLSEHLQELIERQKEIERQIRQTAAALETLQARNAG